MRQRDKNRRKSAVFSFCIGENALFTLQISYILLHDLRISFRTLSDEMAGCFCSILPPFIGSFPHARVTRAPSLGFCTFCFHNLHRETPQTSFFRASNHRRHSRWEGEKNGDFRRNRPQLLKFVRKTRVTS